MNQEHRCPIVEPNNMAQDIDMTDSNTTFSKGTEVAYIQAVTSPLYNSHVILNVPKLVTKSERRRDHKTKLIAWRVTEPWNSGPNAVDLT